MKVFMFLHPKMLSSVVIVVDIVFSCVDMDLSDRMRCDGKIKVLGVSVYFHFNVFHLS